MYISFNVPLKAWVAHLWKDVALITLYSGLIYILYTKFGFETIAIPLSIPTVLGTAISLLLERESLYAFFVKKARNQAMNAFALELAIFLSGRTQVYQKEKSL